MRSLKPLHVEDAVKLVVHLLKAIADPELFSSWALMAVIAGLELDLELLTGEELERPGSINGLTDPAEHQSPAR